MGTINAEWHRAHVMPKNPTDQERANWHYDHALHCGCRQLTVSTIKLLKANGYAIPELPLSPSQGPQV